MKWLLALAGAAAGGLAVAALGGSLDLATRPSILSQLDKPAQLLVILALFGLFAYAWYATHLTLARSKRRNIHYVDRATLDRLAAQERGDDPPALDTPPDRPVAHRPAGEVTR